MKAYQIYTLKILKKIYAKVFNVKPLEKPICENDPQIASNIIYNQLMKDEPCMIARFGSTELNMVINYLGVQDSKNNFWKYIKGESQPWWWDKNRMLQMQNWSGFFPPTEEKIETFCKLMLEDIKQLDVLGSWLNEEIYFEESLKECKKVHLMLLEPFWAHNPWTKALENKKILVIHPFDKTILQQYEKRKNIFINTNILPDFKSLNVIKAVQSLGGNNNFKNWFEALDSMKNKIDEIDYDICLIGAGAYGFPLAAHVKKQGKKALHLGGALQLLFGIKGNRWEDPNYGVEEWGIPFGSYTNLINDNWTKPSLNEKPDNANQVEGACYW